MCVLHLLAAATIEEQRFLHSRALDCVPTIQGMPLFEGGVHLKKYSKLGKGRFNFDLASLPVSCSPLIPGSPMS